MIANSFIKHNYQYIAEALLFYFVLVPIFHLLGSPIPFGNYLLLVIIADILFFIASRFRRNDGIFVPVGLLLIFAAVYFFAYPILSAILLGSFLTWRFMVHQNDPDLNNEIQVLTFTLLLFFVMSIFFYDRYLVWMTMIQVFMLVGGLLIENSFMVKENKISTKLIYSFGFLGILITAGIGFFLAYHLIKPALTFIWGLLGMGLLAFTYLLIDLIELTGLDFSEIKLAIQSGNESNVKMDFSGLDNLFPHDPSGKRETAFSWFNGWTIGIGVFLVLVIIYLLLRRVRKKDTPVSTQQVVLSTAADQLTGKKRGLFRRFQTKPSNKIRLEVLKFEQQAAKRGIGRNQTETIEEWFHRLRLDSTYLSVYQKVRYGSADLTDQEIKLFQTHLNQIKEKLDW